MSRPEPREPVAGVGRQHPSQVPRLGQRGAVRQDPRKVIDETGNYLGGEGLRRLQSFPAAVLLSGRNILLNLPLGSANFLQCQ